MIEINNLTYKYPDGTVALKDINMDFNKGDIIGIIGGNGSGKSTLFSNILGLLRPSQGSVSYKGQELKYSNKFLRNYRMEVNGIFQDPDKQIFYSSVYDDIAFPLRNLELDEGLIRERIDNILESMDSKDLEDRPVHFLSYGQKKRINFAGALALDSKILLLDEPTAGLDPKMTREMISIIKKEGKNRKLIISSHDMDFIYEISDYLYVLAHGQVIGQGTGEEVFLDEELIKKADLNLPWLVKAHKYFGNKLYRYENELEK